MGRKGGSWEDHQRDCNNAGDDGDLDIEETVKRGQFWIYIKGRDKKDGICR